MRRGIPRKILTGEYLPHKRRPRGADHADEKAETQQAADSYTLGTPHLEAEDDGQGKSGDHGFGQGVERRENGEGVSLVDASARRRKQKIVRDRADRSATPFMGRCTHTQAKMMVRI
jgi:hypothetical protein